MENKEIRSIGDLRSEIVRLEAELQERELSIKMELDELTEQVKAPFVFIKKAAGWLGLGEKEEQSSSDWVTMIAQLGFPYLLNSFLFKRSGFLMKLIVALASQKAASGINQDAISGWIEKITQWFKKQGTKKNKDRAENTPPDNENF